jgi:hypothetical protein
MDTVRFRMRMEKRRNTKPKFLGEVLRPLATAQFTPVPDEYSREMPMKARSVRFRGRSLVVGRTAFIFDKHGVCVHTPVGNSVADFNALLTYPGVSKMEEVIETESTIGPDDPTVPFANVPKIGDPLPDPPPAPPAPPPAPPAPVEEPGPETPTEEDQTGVEEDQTGVEALGDQPAQALPRIGRRRRAVTKLQEE